MNFGAAVFIAAIGISALLALLILGALYTLMRGNKP
jgi:hypothetical protein